MRRKFFNERQAVIFWMNTDIVWILDNIWNPFETKIKFRRCEKIFKMTFCMRNPILPKEDIPAWHEDIF